VKVLPAGDVPGRPDRVVSQLLHDTRDIRVVAFNLQPGQQVKPHRSASTVLVQVIEGEGEFSGGDGAARLTAGDAAVYDRDELHGIRALDTRLRFTAIITPRPA
jgi:quercetin dioxygenase-like cupin family protein